MGEAKDRIMTSGLEDVVVATTRLSHVDGEAGRLVIAGYPVEELAPNVSFEEMAFLLLFGNLPSPAEQQKFQVGLSTNFAVIQAQRDLSAARTSELQAVLAYRKALVEIARVQHTTLQSSNVTVVGA